MSKRAHCLWTTQRLPCLPADPHFLNCGQTSDLPLPSLLIPQALSRSHSPSWWAGRTWAGHCGSCWTRCPSVGIHPSPGRTSPPGSWTAQRRPSWRWEGCGGWKGPGGTKVERREIVSRSPPSLLGRRPQGQWVFPADATYWLWPQASGFTSLSFGFLIEYTY